MLHQTRQWFERPHTGSLRPSHVLLRPCFSALYSFLTVWFLLLLLPYISAWRLHPPGKELVLSCPTAFEHCEGSVSWFRDGQPTVLNNSVSKSLVIEDPGNKESGNYTCCHTSNRSGHANCSSSFVVFADEKELPPNLLRDTLPQPGGTPIFKGITYWMPSMLLSFRPRLFLGQTNFSCLYYIRTKIRVPKVEWFYVDSNGDVVAVTPFDALHQHEISTEEFSCPPELIDDLRGTNQYDDFYGIGNHCYRSVLTLKYRALGQNGEYVCQVTAQEGVAVEMPIRFHFPLGYPLERLFRLRVKQEEESTCVADLVAAAYNLSREDLVQRLNGCPRNTRLLTWLSSNDICAGTAVELNCAYIGLMMQIGGDYLRMLSLSDLQTDAQLIDWVRSVSGQVVSGPDPPQGVLLFDANRSQFNSPAGESANMHSNFISRRLQFSTVREELLVCVRGTRFQFSFLNVTNCDGDNNWRRYEEALQTSVSLAVGKPGQCNLTCDHVWMVPLLRRMGHLSPQELFTKQVKLKKLLFWTVVSTCLLTGLVALLDWHRRRGGLSLQILQKMHIRASSSSSSGGASYFTATTTSTTALIKAEDGGRASDQPVRAKQVFPTGLRLPVLRPLQQRQLSLQERIDGDDRFTRLGFFSAGQVRALKLFCSGCHSRIYSGRLSSTTGNAAGSTYETLVAFKTLPGRVCSASTLDQFANEAVLLNRVGCHPNIVRMLGMVKQSRLDGLPLIVLEYVGGPNLLDFLHSKLEQAGPSLSGSALSIVHYDLVGRLFRADLFSIAVDVANAMTHLASLRISHGDLSARNIILTDDFHAKLCDFGLARSYDDCPKEKVSPDCGLPIRWAAPELLTNPPVWHPKSDVWSFGVLLWELFSLGATPYPTCVTERAVAACVLSGWRLALPKFVPPQLAGLFSYLLLSCWGSIGKPDSRLPFSELLAFLRQLLALLESCPARASDTTGYLSMEAEPSQ